MSRKIDVIVPVYDGFEETVQCIESVLNSTLKDHTYLNVINDCSPNDKLTDWLRVMSKKHQFSLHENTENLGFVQTVNRGMELHHDRDVILLNSDTIVAGDWVDRMAVHVEKGSKVSSVTPFSNNATICSFPNFCEENEMLPYSVGLIDKAFAKANAGESEEIPTAIGFCMYITRDSLNDVGLFDADTYGRGYGEENDFCMRSARSGWKHVVAADVFVAHVGGVSFSAEKNNRVNEAQKILDKLYPEYHKLVHQFISRDPLLPFRIKAHVELIQLAQKKTTLLISHNLGGGVEKYTKELAMYIGEGGFFPIIRPSSITGAVNLSLSPLSNDKLSFSLPQDYGRLLDLCRCIGVAQVYVQHTMGLPEKVIAIANDLGCAMDFMIHDYYLINANPTLTSKEGLFCEDFDTRDECCESYYPRPFGVSAQTWREGQKHFLDQCRHIIAPSKYTAKLFSTYFDKYEVQVAYHPDSIFIDYPNPIPVRQKVSEPLRVLVLGAVSKEKGADVLEDAAILSKKEGLNIEFHLLGYSYKPLYGDIVEHGAYCTEEVVEKINVIQPDLIWFPALWPETYSYTLSEALKSGRPILASNFGSFPERLQGRAYSWIHSWNSSAKLWLDFMQKIAKGEAGSFAGTDEWRTLYCSSKDFYMSFWDRVEHRSFKPFELSRFELYSEPVKVSRKERLLLYLIKCRSLWGVRTIVRNIPQPLKDRVRVLLSKRTLHDLLMRNK